MTKFVGVLTSGGDCPGLNAAIRGVGKAARVRRGTHHRWVQAYWDTPQRVPKQAGTQPQAG